MDELKIFITLISVGEKRVSAHYSPRYFVDRKLALNSGIEKQIPLFKFLKSAAPKESLPFKKEPIQKRISMGRMRFNFLWLARTTIKWIFTLRGLRLIHFHFIFGPFLVHFGIKNEAQFFFDFSKDNNQMKIVMEGLFLGGQTKFWAVCNYIKRIVLTSFSKLYYRKMDLFLSFWPVSHQAGINNFVFSS